MSLNRSQCMIETQVDIKLKLRKWFGFPFFFYEANEQMDFFSLVIELTEQPKYRKPNFQNSTAKTA